MRKRDMLRLRKVYILPNLFTAFNMFLGLLVIYNVYMAQEDPTRLARACWLGVLAGFLDLFDGAVARMTKSTSHFGSEFDSLADLVSFGVAPSLGAFHIMRVMDKTPDRVIVALVGLYAICGALRLARYNVQAKSSERRGFLGLPIPAGAGGLTFSILLIDHYKLIGANGAILIPFPGGGIPVASIVSVVFPCLVGALALLMVSEIPYPHLAQKLRLQRQMSFGSLVSVLMVGVLIWALTHDERVALLFIMGWIYILYSPVAALYRLIKRRRDAQQETAARARGEATAPKRATGS